jgi:hypothetical protein
VTNGHTFAWRSARISGSSRVELVREVVLPLVVVGHVCCGHVIVHGREALRYALVAKRHDIVFIIVRVRSECEHVLAAAKWQATGAIEVVLDVLWTIKVAGHLEGRLAERIWLARSRQGAEHSFTVRVKDVLLLGH